MRKYSSLSSSGTPANCHKGYLRAGKILQLLSRKDDATSVYKRGLLKVPSTDPLYQVSQGLCPVTIQLSAKYIPLGPPKNSR
jgi:hypothetical protein